MKPFKPLVDETTSSVIRTAAMDSMGDWDGLLQHLLSSDNSARNDAENRFSQLKYEHCDATLVALLDVIHSRRDDAVRSLAAVLLRRVLLRDTVSLWPRASTDTRERVKSELLAIVQDEVNRSIRRKTCDIVGELGSTLLADKEWPALLPTLLQWLTPSASVELRESTLRVFERLAIYLASELESEDDIDQSQPLDVTLLNALAACLQDGQGRVTLNAVRALGMIVIQLESLENTRQELLQATVPLVLQALHRFIQMQDFDTVMEVLEVLIEMTEPNASYFTPCLREVVALMTQLSDVQDNPNVPNGCRQLAMEFLVSLAEQAPSRCRRLKNNGFVSQVYPVTFRMMLELPDKDTWSVMNCGDEAEDEDGPSQDISNFDVGSEALERLVSAIGPRKSLPVCFSLIQEYVTRQDDWVCRHAALVGLCQILEVIPPTELETIVQSLTTHAYDPHPRVCCTAIDVIGQLSVDQTPQFQQGFHDQALPILLRYVSDNDHVRLQAHAATALRQFVDLCPPEIVTPYLESILQPLMTALQYNNSTRIVQEQIITAIGSVATVSGSSFTQYYSVVMPTLHTILLSCLQAATKIKSNNISGGPLTLAGIALECISIIGVAVGNAVFANDAHAVLKIMAEMHNTPHMVGDDNLRTYLLQAWARFCTCLKQDVAPYLPVVMPTLLDAATQQAEFEVDPSQLTDDDDTDGDTDRESYAGDGIQLAQVNDKYLRIRTSVLEEKATACQLLASIVSDLEEAFFPYAEQVTQVLAPLLTDSVHSDIRSAAVEAMGALLRCVALAATNDESIKQMLDYVLGRLVHALTSEPELKLVLSIMQSMKKCIMEARSRHALIGLNAAQLKELVKALLVILADSFQRRVERRGREMSDDEESVEEDEEELELEADLPFVLADCVGTLAQTHQEAFFPIFQRLLWDKLVELTDPQCLDEDRQLALYILDDVLEHCGVPAMERLDTMLPTLLHVLKTSQDAPSCQQAASYGVGVCARLGGERFTPHAASSLELLKDVIAHPDAQSDARRNASDNAVAAIGLICVHHANAVDVATIVPQWLGMLPLTGDLEESVAVTSRLCEYVSLENATVLGESGENVSKVVSVLAEVAANRETFVERVGEDEAREQNSQIAAALAKIRSMLSEETLAPAWASLTPAQQYAVHTLFAQ